MKSLFRFQTLVYSAVYSIVFMGLILAYSDSSFGRPLLESLESFDSSDFPKSPALLNAFNVSPGALDGLPTLPFSKECDPRWIEQSWGPNFKNKTPAQNAAELEQLWNKCDRFWTRNSKWSITTLLKLSGFKDPFKKDPRVQSLKLDLPSGFRVSGLLATQWSETPRPFVFVFCGVACDTSDKSQMLVLAHLFQESPFNVFIMASTSGLEFIEDNGIVGAGQFQEARLGEEAIQMLLSEHYLRSRTSSFHLSGISYGGLSALLLTAKWDKEKTHGVETNHFPLSSTTAVCPVIQLKPTIQDLLDSLWFGRWFKNILKNNIQMLVKKQSPLFQHLPGPLKKLKTSQEYFDFTEIALTKTFEQLSYGSGEMWTANSFLPQLKYLKTPTMVIGSKDDPIVRADVNFQALKQALEEHGKGNLPLQILVSARGSHCAHDIATGWSPFSLILRARILGAELSKTDSINGSVKSQRINLSQVPLYPSESISSVSLEADKDPRFLNVVVQIWDAQKKISSGNFTCGPSGPYDSHVSCFRSVSFKVHMPHALWNEWNPEASLQEELSKEERTHLTRWLNVRALVLDADRQPLIMSKKTPALLSWVSYQ